MWMCHTSYVPGQKGCSYFQWAEFDDDGNPPWAMEAKVRENEQIKNNDTSLKGASPE